MIAGTGSRIPRRNAFTLVEVMMSLAITALLLLAMASAFTAAGSAVENNDRYFRAVQQGRVALDLVMGEIRRCQAVGSCSSSSVTVTASAGDYNGDSLTFAYSSGQLSMTDNTSGIISVLATDLTGATFTSQGSSNNTIALAMTVQIGGDQITMSNSAAPRYLLTSQWN